MPQTMKYCPSFGCVKMDERTKNCRLPIKKFMNKGNKNDLSYFFEDFTEDVDVMDDLLVESPQPADELTQAMIQRTLNMIRMKHPSDFAKKNRRNGGASAKYCENAQDIRKRRRRGRLNDKTYRETDIPGFTSSFFVNQISSFREDLNDENEPSTSNSSVIYRRSKSKRICNPRMEDLHFIPEITDGLPLPSARRNSAAIIDNSEILSRACGGFRLFVRTFSDETLKRCLKHPLFDTYSERGVSKELRYIHILRQVWLHLPDDERYDWQKLYESFIGTSEADICGFVSADVNCIEKEITRKNLHDRIYIQSIDVDKLPCPICERSLPKRYNRRELYIHLSQAHCSVHLYACQYCNRAFLWQELLKQHECQQFRDYFTGVFNDDEAMFTFNYSYVSLVCAECGFHLMLSPQCDEELFTSSFINCILTHSSSSFAVVFVYSAEPLKASSIRIGFHRVFPKNLRCSYCDETSEFKEVVPPASFSNIFELDKHFRLHHKKHITAKKCIRCPASFFNMDVYKDHILSHMTELPLITLFMDWAPIFPPLLDRRSLVIRVANDVDFSRLADIDDSADVNDDELEEISVRRSIRKKRIDEVTRIVEKEPVKKCKTKSTWDNYCHILQDLNYITDVAGLKSYSEFLFSVVFDGRTIVENPVNGYVLNDDVFECKQCNSVFIGKDRMSKHITDCYDESATLNGEDDFSRYVNVLFDSRDRFPFSRISCGYCDAKCCSIIALSKHCAITHAVFLKHQKNNSVIQEAANVILEKNWIKTSFDDYLINEMEKAHKARIAESESEDDDNYISYMNCSLSPLAKSKSLVLMSNNEVSRENSHSPRSANQENSLRNVESRSRTPRSFVDDEELEDSILIQNEDPVESQNVREASNPSDRFLSAQKSSNKSGDKENERSESAISDSLSATERLWSANPYRHRPTTHRRYTCFLCCFSYEEISTLNEHLEEHPEQWSRCPLCIHNGQWTKHNWNAFYSNADFFRHMKDYHMNEENQIMSCKFCDIVIPSANSRQNVSSIIRHIVYECVASSVCFLCDDWKADMNKGDLISQLNEHRRRQHGLIFDRYICSVCLKGFHSNDVFLRHECEPTVIRCRCNPFHLFANKDEFSAHVLAADVTEAKSHEQINPRLDPSNKSRYIKNNDEYEHYRLKKALIRKYYGPVRENIFTDRIGDVILARRQFILPRVASKDNLVKFSHFVQTKRGREIVATAGEGIVSEAFDVLQSIVDYVHSSIPPNMDALEMQYNELFAKGQDNGTSVTNASRNISSIVSQESFKCEYCPFTTIFIDKLLTHRKKEHNDGKEYGMPLDLKVFLCRSCCYVFNKIVEYERHLESHAVAIACKQCSCVSGRDCEFYQHRKNHHTSRAIFACTKCLIMYTREAMFMLHMVKQHGVRLAYFCKTCGICNTNLSAMYDHIAQEPCRKLLTIDYIGFVDASQVQFLPNSMLWLQRVLNAPQPLKLVELNRCRHKRCLNARFEPLVSCLKCNCLTTLPDFKGRSGLSDEELKAKINFELAKDNNNLNLQDILHELSKPNDDTLTFSLKVEGCDQRLITSISQKIPQSRHHSISLSSKPQRPNGVSNLVNLKTKPINHSTTALKHNCSKTQTSETSISKPIRDIKTEVDTEEFPSVSASKTTSDVCGNKNSNKSAMNNRLIKEEPIEIDESPIALQISTNSEVFETGNTSDDTVSTKKSPLKHMLLKKKTMGRFNGIRMPGLVTGVSVSPSAQQIRKRLLPENEPNSIRPKILCRQQASAAPAGAPLNKPMMIRNIASKCGESTSLSIKQEPEFGSRASDVISRSRIVNSVRNLDDGHSLSRPHLNRLEGPLRHVVSSRVGVPYSVLQRMGDRTRENAIRLDMDELRLMDEEYTSTSSSIWGPLNQPKHGGKRNAAPIHCNVVAPFEKWCRKTRALMDDQEIIVDRINYMKRKSHCERYLCVSCKAVHIKQSDAVLHQFQSHRVKGLRYSLMCPVCKTVFSDLTLFYAHLVTDKRHTKLTHRSKWCNFSFCTPEEADQHDREHNAAAGELYMPCNINCCGICGTAKNYWFTRLDDRTFIDHTVFHGFRTSVVCRICHSRFDTDKLALLHYKDHHLRQDPSGTDERNYCRQCRGTIGSTDIYEHFDESHKYVMIEFVPELDNELVISASMELQNRFNI